MNNFVDIGIHLGLSNCSVAFWNPQTQAPEICNKNDNRKRMMPSYVSFSQLPTELLIGEAAEKDNEREYVIYDSLKFIGKIFEEVDEREDELENYLFDFMQKENLVQLGVKTSLSENEKEWFYPEEIVGYLLKEMIRNVKMKINEEEIRNVAISVPDDFDYKQKEAIVRACKLAGLNKFELIDEAMASMIFVKYLFEEKNNSLKNVVIINFTDETLNVSCCVLDDSGEIGVKSSGTNQLIGGKDFKNIIIDMIKEQLIVNSGDDTIVQKLFEKKSRQTRKERREMVKRRNELMIQAEEVNRTLTNCHNVTIEFNFSKGKTNEDSYFVSIDRQEFEEHEDMKELIEKFEDTILKTLENANIDANEIELVLPIGESCNIPMIKRKINEMFGEGKIFKHPKLDIGNR